MAFICLHDKQKIEKLLRRNIFLNIYAIGDLDPMFWPYTQWYGVESGDELTSAVCMFNGPNAPTLMALADHSTVSAAADLLRDITYLLPYRFFAHLSPGLEDVFDGQYLRESGEHYLRMALTAPETALSYACKNCSGSSEAVRMGRSDIPQMLELYARSYPGNWFDPGKLEINRCFGIRDGDRLISVAGTHVYSPEYGVAAAGNITTDPDYRGMGYGTAATAALCSCLLSKGCMIGLNVKAGNKAAIASYMKLGFEQTDEFREFTLTKIPESLK